MIWWIILGLFGFCCCCSWSQAAYRRNYYYQQRENEYDCDHDNGYYDAGDYYEGGE